MKGQLNTQEKQMPYNKNCFEDSYQNRNEEKSLWKDWERYMIENNPNKYNSNDLHLSGLLMNKKDFEDWFINGNNKVWKGIFTKDHE